jgi:hypothetical protein
MLHSSRRFRFHSDTPKEWVRAGRTLLIINIIVLIVSCFTEHFWTWDGFLRGGQDFELSLLALLAFFCLILVFAQYFRRKVSDLLDRRDDACITDDLSFPSPYAAPFLRSFLAERPPGYCPSLGSIVLRI